MKTSEHGLAIIKRWEGCRLAAYQDTGGIWTIGWGHIAGVHKGMTCTMDMAQQLLEDDMHAAEREIARTVKVVLEQHEFDALASFEFNTGGLMLRTSKGAERPSQVLRSLNEGDKMAAANHLLDWIYDNGVAVDGLRARRLQERRLFLGLA